MKTLTVVNTGGSYGDALAKAYYDPFSKATGIKIQTVVGSNLMSEMRDQVTSKNYQWDIVQCAPPDVAANSDIMAPITQPTASGGALINWPGGRYMYLNDIEALNVIAYNTKNFPHGGPTTPAEFFDVKAFPGSRSIPNFGIETAFDEPAYALLAAGTSVKNITPMNFDLAYKELDKIKGSLRVVWTDFTQSQDILRSGEVAAELMADGRALQLQQAGVPIKISFTGSTLALSGMCLPKGDPKNSASQTFFDWAYQHPQQEALFTKLTGYGPPTKAGEQAAEAMGIKDFSTLHLSQMADIETPNEQYIAKNSQELLNRWNKWLSTV